MIHVGQRLHEVRLRRKLSIEEIASATKIKPSFLSAIEKGEFHKLPSSAYAHGFVRNYASYLGLPRAEISALFKREFDEQRVFKVLPDSLTRTQEITITRVRVQQSVFMVIGVCLLVIGYLFFQYRSAFFAPALAVSSPSDVVTSQDITIRGKADSNSIVTVNNEPVAITTSGDFSKHIALFPGKSTITIKAKNKFGKESILQKNITVK